MGEAIEEMRQRLQQIGYALHSPSCGASQADELRQERDRLERELVEYLAKKEMVDPEIDALLGEFISRVAVSTYRPAKP